MLTLKDTNELDEYTYKVCEVSACDDEATDFYEEESLDLCYNHYRYMIHQEHLF
jgi:hypothetical protein